MAEGGLVALLVVAYAGVVWGLWKFGKAQGAHGWRAVLAGGCVVFEVVASEFQALAYRVQLNWLERKLTNATTLATMREVYRELGIDLDHLTDDELLEGALQMGEMYAHMGLTADEAAAALEKVVRAMREA